MAKVIIDIKEHDNETLACELKTFTKNSTEREIKACTAMFQFIKVILKDYDGTAIGEDDEVEKEYWVA